MYIPAYIFVKPRSDVASKTIDIFSYTALSNPYLFNPLNFNGNSMYHPI